MLIKDSLEILCRSVETHERMYIEAQRAADEQVWEKYDSLINAKIDMSFVLLEMKSYVNAQDLTGFKACAERVRKAMSHLSDDYTETRFAKSELDTVASSLEAL